MGCGKKRKTFHKCYGVLFGILTLLVGALFIMQVWSIYRSPIKKPYTLENISTHFKEIAPFVWAWVIALAGNILFSFIFPKEKEKPLQYKDDALAVKRLRARLKDDGRCVDGINKAKAISIVLWTVFGLAFLFTLVVCRFYLSKTAYTSVFESEFFSQHNGTAERLVKILPWIFSTLLLAIAAIECTAYRKSKQAAVLKAHIAERAKAQKEAKQLGKTEEDLQKDKMLKAVSETVATLAQKGRLNRLQPRMQACIKEQEREQVRYERICEEVAIKREKQVRREEHRKKVSRISPTALWTVRALVFVGAVVLIVIGASNGGMLNLWEKAEKICTQCIGLG